MAEIDVLENLPEINMLKDEGITLESLQNEMIADYEAYYEKLTGEALTLYPADSRRLMINVTAGKLYQLAVIINERHKQNFLQYMYGNFTKNWAANFGFKESGIERATTTLRFHLSQAQAADVRIPAGTRATSGDKIFFATDEDAIILAGNTYADTSATCTSEGTVGNGYIIGQLNIIVDPVNFVESVENTTNSAGGHDEYTNQELKELIYNFPSTYSTAGPEDCYAQLTKQYSSNIIDAKVIPNKEAVVQIYILLQNGNIPGTDYCEAVLDFLKNMNATPDTDKVEILAPDVLDYEIDAVYYIASSKKNIADSVCKTVEEAAEGFAEYTKSKIGRSINPNVLIAYANAAGASRVEISSPGYAAVAENQVAICTRINMTYGGLENE